MSFQDGSRSTVGGSDENHGCGPCKSRGKQNYAEYHCRQCLEFLCTACKEQHKRFKVSRDHYVVNISESVMLGEVVKCSPCATEGRDITANHYCDDCQEYFCNSCLEAHRNFRISKEHKIRSISVSLKSQEDATKQSTPAEDLSKLSLGSPPALVGDNVQRYPDLGGDVTAPTESINHNDNFLNLKIKSSSKVNIKLPKDEQIPIITSCEFLPNGELLLVDHHNCSLKLLDKSLKVKDSYDLFPYKPWDVASLDDKTVIVTCPRHNQLHYIQVYPSFKLGTSIMFDKECYGVSVASGNIYITCHDNARKPDNFTPGDIRVLDTRGNELKRIGGEKDGKIRIFRPNYTAVTGNVIYVSDETGRITALTDEDEIIFEYRPYDMRLLTALCVDPQNNILVGALSTHNVQVITAAGRKHKNLLISSDNIREPEGMGYRPSDRTLVVGCAGQDDLCVFKLG